MLYDNNATQKVAICNGNLEKQIADSRLLFWGPLIFHISILNSISLFFFFGGGPSISFNDDVLLLSFLIVVATLGIYPLSLFPGF